MEATQVKDDRSLRAWLSDKPKDWAQSIALRAALRALPYISISNEVWLKNFALLPLGAVITSWFQQTDESIFVISEESRANARFGGHFFDFVGYRKERIAAIASDASYYSADAQSKSPHVLSDCEKGVSQAAEAFRSAAVRQGELGENGDLAAGRFWRSVVIDCQRLTHLSKSAASTLTVWPLWDNSPAPWRNEWQQLAQSLSTIDPNYSVWIDWYERRIRGERAAFDIPGDKGRVEDKKILRRLAEATNEDFWGKGHEYVNATLKGWLDEARKRVAPPQPDGETEIRVPLQEPHAIAYGVNNDGMIDRLPHSDQTQLRDLPNQRRAYADLREIALELREEGQRLGPRLQPRIERAVASLPEKFDDAEAWPVWRDFNALRRLFRAHQIAFANPEPDTAKLEPVIAETLGGLLDIYNNFAFTDDGLRAKDENRISPQERASAEAEAVAASPVIEAIRYAPSIATDLAREDIIADAENIEMPVGDPYGAQVLDQANRTRRNWLAGAFEGARRAMANPKIVGKAIAIGVVGGAAGVVGKVAMTGMVGLEYGPLLQFIATNAAILQNYAAVAFSSYPQLNDLIERISVMWKTRKSSSS